MKNTVLIFLILMVPSALAWGQDAQELKSKYGAPLEVYRVRPGVWGLPKYDEKGQVCEITLVPNRKTGDEVNFDESLPMTEVEGFISEIAPNEMRGKENPYSNLGLILGIGGLLRTSKTFENVSIVYLKPFGLGRQVSRKERDSNSKEFEASMVVIKWEKRKCR